MNPVARGVRNAFRNTVRTISIVIILGLSIGLSLTMLVANKAVGNKIAAVKSSIGNTITVAPAGFTPGSQTNNALTTTELDSVKSLSHVSSVTETLTDRESTTGATSFGGFRGPGGGGSSSSSTTTSLTSPVTLGANRFNGGGESLNSTDPTSTFSLPISFLGTTDPSQLDGTAITIKSGTAISGTATTNDALISETMATKNNLKVGDTFTAYNATLTVAGIFTTSTTNRSDENTVILSLVSLQRLSGQAGTITSAVVTVDSLDNLSSTTVAVTKAIGSSADVTSSQEEADNTVKPLNNVKTVSTFSLIGSVVAGSAIILLTMIMIVRERKQEIGVVKAIGGSNLKIVSEFMVESLTLALMGAVVGLIIGVAGGQPVTKLLVNNSTSTSTTATMQGGPGRFGGAGGVTSTSTTRPTGFGGGARRSFQNNQAVKGIRNIKAQIGLSILAYGLGAALLIAIIGSGLAAAMIAKVRPSTVMRAD